MATIITIHGTFATGPNEGEAWWQRGSEFEKDIRRYVESEDGTTLEFKPFVWDGLNSETSRRAAGSRLFDEMVRLERADAPYCLLAHSHGGSVTGTALARSAIRRTPLPHLRKWITVGTPFARVGKPPSVYVALSLFNKAVYLSLAISFVILAAELIIIAGGNPSEFVAEGGLLGGLVVACAVPLLAFHLFHARKLRTKSSFLDDKASSFCKDQFLGRWIGLRHPADEAISALQSAYALNPKIFPERFAVAQISSLSLFVLLALIVVLAVWPEPATAVCDRLGGNIRNWLCEHIDKPHQSVFVATLARAQLFVGLAPRSIMASVITTEVDSELALIVILIGLAMVVAWLILFSLFLVWLFQIGGLHLSSWLSRRLDSSTLKQLRRSSLGVDGPGENAVGCHVYPVWGAELFRPLPERLSSEMSAVSDRDAARFLSRFRETISRLPVQDGKLVSFDPLLSCLTWNELIHTSYFVVPRFRKLVCYAIAHAPGFRPSDAFKRDPDYALIGRWLEEIRPKQADATQDAEVRIATDHAAPAPSGPS